ncbi:hypothetical protein ERO13_D03G125800v2 [Gossypium hirsutum]|uniref:Protein TRM32-like isoform X1 n=1 Tax=Gossypium hirsutum TaxID=3635 RepID=A0A1U8NN68_GOSHI|nr:protein TRM32 isoform X1 [Gossypium hirsutum]XP_016740437.1 protein TRM32 isoform X1 [Gossypium hirsutum]XP_016740438.1 protein TRM32 isoform X1 [Gossypium hirsutum]XP_016740439.1 protein TRM32 isoform X1 [Gossypium hirsutum]XP_016740440.1 protein TRM32 isoform X1 [Gossypium hirsutum]KAG4155667.1 hypothetical protein ERO13_D03G125800v2 [Gossypium hirsutum]KAG4155668.1 hypothetical protein ERO13_D03G125800v2 [Gossypium hirsutum]KAG4155669.1 hypothetical protein ERO13_D03G125800v2 [Gossypiu
MGREFDNDDDVEFGSYHHHHPGCMGAIFDYHHWYNVKKMFPYRKYNRGRHVRCCANPRTISMEREVIETQGLLHAEVDHFQVPQQTRKTSLSINKGSNKTSTKAFSARPELLQMYSTHHLEHSGFGFGWINPIILINMRTDTSGMSSTSSPAEGKTSDSPRTRYLRFSTLEHKQKEVWSFRKGEKKQVAGTQSSQGSDSQKRNRFVMNRLKDFKQKIKQAIKESKKGTNHTIQASINEDGTDLDINNGGLNRMSRTKLINESLDRYTESFKHGAHNGPKSISIGEGIDKFELVEAVIEAELQENMREINNPDNFSSTCLSMETNDENIAKPCDLAMEETSPHQEQERVCEDNPSREQEVDLCYNYVRDILELSGLLQNQCLHPWYSPHQPLNPLLFKQLETLLHPELKHCSIDDHQLVFDLVNEALVGMSEKACVHKFPKPFNRGIGLMFKGNAVLLQEVWRYVSGNMGFQQEHDGSLDDIVGRDMEKDAWMFLQGEDDFVALELQELVFDGLLDELLCD